MKHDHAEDAHKDKVRAGWTDKELSLGNVFMAENGEHNSSLAENDHVLETKRKT